MIPQISKKITGEVQITTDTKVKLLKEIKGIPDFKKIIDSFAKEETSRILEIIFGGAIILDASDVHIEPEEEKAKIRIRTDGILQDVTLLDQKIYQNVLSRIKLLSGIKLNIFDRPQDGRFSIIGGELENKEKNKISITDSAAIEVRVSTLPAEHGESIVLRILSTKNLISLETLGLREDLLSAIKNEIKKQNGMVVITGPTGSGKTTTLYAFLEKITKPEIKIITIEDPIEYHLKGVSQTQVSPEKGYDFASGLKSIMRQDPDVILVGEIRDTETVQIALQAALTGHLVFATLHTNDAAGTIARMISLGATPVNIAPAINMAIAQRLVRKICDKCGTFEKISLQDLSKIKKELQGIPEKIKIPELDKETRIPKIKGCSYCNFTGYRQRMGIFEAFLVDEEMERFILSSPSITSLKEKAVKKGMVTLKQDGIIKVLERLTTIEEVERVAGE